MNVDRLVDVVVINDGSQEGPGSRREDVKNGIFELEAKIPNQSEITGGPELLVRGMVKRHLGVL